MKKIIMIAIFCLFAMRSFAYAQNPTDYLILQSIGNFSSDGKGKCGERSGIIGAADHFDEDHNVLTCSTDYYNFQQKMAVEIKVEQHSGGDSDRWILHELDIEFRNYYGIPGKSYAVVPVDANPILEFGSAGWDYRWISGNKAIKVEYHDPQMTKPEPLEVVKAYLAKHPSTIQPFTLQQLRSEVSTIKWIKDEMERRLWLCDKWNVQFQAGKVPQDDLLKELFTSMKVFLNYRQKYYSVTATDDINAFSVYLKNNDAASIQAKLSEYKVWWLANKARTISL